MGYLSADNASALSGDQFFKASMDPVRKMFSIRNDQTEEFGRNMGNRHTAPHGLCIYVERHLNPGSSAGIAARRNDQALCTPRLGGDTFPRSERRQHRRITPR